MNCSQAALTDANDFMSSLKKVTPTPGLVLLISVMTRSAASAFRPVKYTWAGWCLARARADAFPNPAVPKSSQHHTHV